MLALYHKKPTSFSANSGLPMRRWQIMRRLVDRLGADQVMYVADENTGNKPGVFSSYYRWMGDKAPYVELVNELAHADMVVDRLFYADKYPETEFPIISSPKFRAYSTDKFAMYTLLKDFIPRTYLLAAGSQPREDWFAENNEVIIKTRRGMGGKGVKKVLYKEFLGAAPYSEDFVLQEFVESNGEAGGLGVGIGMHDVRAYIAGSEIVGSHMRVPVEGNFVSNTNVGGTLSYLDPKDLPAELMSFVDEICKVLPDVPRQFSVDSFYDPKSKEWKMIEINARAGWPSANRGELGLATLDRIADYIVSEYRKVKQK